MPFDQFFYELADHPDELAACAASIGRYYERVFTTVADLRHTWNVNAGGWGYQQYDDPDKLEEAYKVKFNEIIRQQKELGISGAVYTQTTDVQGEVNGLVTYDRKVIKIPVKKLQQIHQKLHN
jgi:hypothetical protein